MGWRRGCLAAGLLRSTVCYYCLGGCSALVVCARHAPQLWRVQAGARSRFSPWSSLAFFAVHVAGCPVQVSLPFACRNAISCGLCVLRARSGCPLGPRRVSVECVCARAPAAYAPPPRVGVACALRAVLVRGAGRAVPDGSCPSAFPAPVLCSADLGLGGLGPVPLYPCLAWRWPATHWPWVRGVWARGPVTNPAARALQSWLRALWGRHEGT